MSKIAKSLINMKSKMVILCVVLFLFNFSAYKNSMAGEVKEYAVKAAFVFNFIKFIQWPGKETLTEQNSPYQLCFIGNNTVAKEFTKLNGKTIGSKTLDTHRLLQAKECEKCKVIFISRDTDPLTLKEVISRVKGKPVLTIGETKAFTKFGGVISFFLENDHLHFAINTKAAKIQGLKMSSRLLKLAVIVDG